MSDALNRPGNWLGQFPWATFLLPFLVFGVATSFEPKPPEIASSPRRDAGDLGLESTDASTPPAAENEIRIAARQKELRDYRRYPLIYTAKIALTCLAMLVVWRGYRAFPWRVSLLAPLVGVVGVVLWIGLCKLDWELKILGPLGLANYFRDLGQRSAFNPFVELSDNPAWAYGFLAIRFFGLACVVPVIEEFFLRGFVMRVVVDDAWEEVPFGTATRASLLAGAVLPMLSHPGELFAALAWFSLVSWLMVRTRNIWDCVVAHATTNLLLGIYVVTINTPESWRLM